MADEKSADPTEDQELNDLLDSALQDFSKEHVSESKSEDHAASTSEPISDDNLAESAEDAWTRDFIKQAADHFGENFQNLIQNGSENELGASFQKIAQTVASVMTETNDTDREGVDTDFQAVIAQALNELSVTSENLQTEADLSEMFGQTSLEDGIGNIMPLMEGMLQHLVSKDILYPPLKQLVDKYPEWLEQKKSTISATDLQSLTKQLELMRKVCTEFEKEKVEDSQDVKKKRFGTIVSLMQEMQNCGELPEELVGEHSALFQFDP